METTTTTTATKFSNYGDMYDRCIDGLVEAGFSPIDDPDLPDSDQPYSSGRTATYYARKGWEAVRHNGDSLTFALYGDEGCKLMTTTTNGVIDSEASFDFTRHGIRMFTTCAALLP